MIPKTIFDKIWENHVVKEIDGGPSILYIDRHFIHEVTSPQAFGGLKRRGLKVFRPEKTFATCDHNVPTINQHQPIKDPLSAIPVEELRKNTAENGIRYFPLGNPSNGVVHIIGPELGITQCGMTIVCGDSHTSTHGALGNIAFGIGTSEVEMVLATQTLLQTKPKQMLVKIEGKLNKGVGAKDIILHIISKLGTSGGTGYFLEFAGSTIEQLSMEERMTICNMSIEMGARGGLIAPDHTTFEYLKGREYSPEGEKGEIGAKWDKAVEKWNKLKSDSGCTYDSVHLFSAEEIEPMITYGTNPSMAIPVDSSIPKAHPEDTSLSRALEYMGFQSDKKIAGHKIDYVFLGSCTNGRVEDFRAFVSLVKGRQKAPHVTAWLVPGSKMVEKQIEEEGLGDILRKAGFEVRQPGCSACLGMNDDKIPAGKYAVSTSNRNFEGRQGPGARTLLAGPLVAAAAAVTGVITDPRELI
ncbi:MAG: 3-isopropylmalate dehydratase large subunit [Bacteroidetes bacterium GWE2_39_28]|nr:MAG: 3-isopropylmalate dehydratase large subunit [Bacteroidetes bacterium GWE2_39_28]OFY14871.1 MAG: 3-isopropylmalate dehydratase large subunit [Bacteroidetes bacterium GWF2_39_10]OFZ07763.1 MAG: 3-isopropylmalate dehydratase large subunit [Bacteroidetes bacterium RIFOXYB2_FULL_39_7]OFZ10731.1 MAG: 3-isopropylmalate dehydratase large subunit [Bacteroidetes bacterium RIFOXYC2_FULL_39_11]HCT93233.1 3-isopropylmalate dehydratase large subunit [Rikenellaceae bacterium]